MGYMFLSRRCCVLCSSMGLLMALYVVSIVSIYFSLFPYVVDVSALSVCIVMRAFIVVLTICLLYVSLGSRVITSICGLMLMGSVVLFICRASCVLYSTGSDVKRVHVMLPELRMSCCLCPCMYFLYTICMIESLFLLCLCCVLMLWRCRFHM